MHHSDGCDFLDHPLASGANGAQVEEILLDLIALLCLLALLTHEHLFWFVAIILAFIDIPDFLTPVNSIATSMKSLAAQEAGEKPAEATLVDESHVKSEGAHHA